VSETSPDYIALKKALVRRVDGLWESGILTGEIIERARLDDCVLTIDFEGGRFKLCLVPRVRLARIIPADSDDEVLVAMTKGQPPIAKGETVAAWFVVAQWEGAEPIVEVHGPLRAWRTAQGTA